jgi:hypothetical protein
VANTVFGKDDFKKLYGCRSIDALRECAAADPPLAEKYKARLQLSKGTQYLRIAPRTIVWVHATKDPTEYPVLGVAKEARSTIVKTLYRGSPVDWVLRMRHEWLLVSERYYGRAKQLFPRSPTFRWYRP